MTVRQPMVATPETAVIEGTHGYYLAGPASFIEEAKETAWAGAAAHITIRPGFSWLVGRYVEANTPNQNGHIFGLADLQTNHASVVNTPVNIGHQGEYIVGHTVASELLYPAGVPGEQLAAARALQPHVETLSAFWRGLFPAAYDKLLAAHSVGSLFTSMECVPLSLTCKTLGGCGLEYPYDGVQSPTYCDELNAHKAPKVLNHPYFIGTGLIAPPLRPGWRRADVTDISALVRDNLDRLDAAAALHAQLTTQAPHLSVELLEELMVALLAGSLDADDERLAPRRTPTVSELIGKATAYGQASARADAELAESAGVGVIVALVPPPEVAEQLAVEGGEAPEVLHVTLCFLGQAMDDTLETGVTRSEVRAALAAFCSGAPPIGPVKVSGTGHFDLAPGQVPGVQAHYASIDAPALSEFRSRLVAALEAAGVMIHRDHGFSPHLTRRYTAAGQGPPDVPAGISWDSNTVELWWGDASHESFATSGGVVPFVEVQG